MRSREQCRGHAGWGAGRCSIDTERCLPQPPPGRAFLLSFPLPFFPSHSLFLSLLSSLLLNSSVFTLHPLHLSHCSTCCPVHSRCLFLTLSSCLQWLTPTPAPSPAPSPVVHTMSSDLSTPRAPRQAAPETRLGPYLFTFRPTGDGEPITIPGLLVPLQWPVETSPATSFNPQSAPYSAFVYTEFSAAPVQPVWNVGSQLQASWVAPPGGGQRPTLTTEAGHKPQDTEEGGKRKVEECQQPALTQIVTEQSNAQLKDEADGNTAEKDQTAANPLDATSRPQDVATRATWSGPSAAKADLPFRQPVHISSSGCPPRPPRRVSAPQRPGLPLQWKAESPKVEFRVTSVDSQPVKAEQSLTSPPDL